MRLVNILATVTIISSGLIALIGLVSPEGAFTATIADFMLRMVSVTAGIAVVVGLMNLLMVHLRRFVRAETGWPYSIIVLVTMLAVILLRALDRSDIWPGDLEGEMISARVFEAVQVSLESALASLLFVFLIYAAYRLMRREMSIWHVIFTVAALIALLGWIPLDNAEQLAEARDWIIRVPVGAGARGILIGVGLGTLTVGARVLTGQDRAFRD